MKMRVEIIREKQRREEEMRRREERRIPLEKPGASSLPCERKIDKPTKKEEKSRIIVIEM